MAGLRVHALFLALALLFLQTTSVSPGETDGAVLFLTRAERHFKSGRIDDALAELKQAAGEFPRSPRPLVAMATVLLEARRELEAVQMLRDAAELHRQHSRLSAASNSGHAQDGFGIATRTGILANLATMLYQAGDAAGAVGACEEALTVQPLHARCYYIFGVSMLTSGQWREEGNHRSAHRSLAASARLFSSAADRANALFALGTLRLRGGQMEGAASSFEAALHLAPDRLDVLMRVGEMRSRFARHADALTIFQAAEHLRPDHAESTIQCGNALRRLKQLNAALKKYKEVNTHKSASHLDKAEALYWIGSVRETQGKKTKAEKAYKQALEAEPAHARALNNLGSMLMARNDPVRFCFVNAQCHTHEHTHKQTHKHITHTHTHPHARTHTRARAYHVRE